MPRARSRELNILFRNSTHTTRIGASQRVGPNRPSVLVVGLADVMLGVELDAELGNKTELRLEIVDVLFLVVHELLEQVAADVILDRMAVRRGLLIESARGHFRRQVA